MFLVAPGMLFWVPANHIVFGVGVATCNSVIVQQPWLRKSLCGSGSDATSWILAKVWIEAFVDGRKDRAPMEPLRCSTLEMDAVGIIQSIIPNISSIIPSNIPSIIPRRLPDLCVYSDGVCNDFCCGFRSMGRPAPYRLWGSCVQVGLVGCASLAK